MAPDTAVQLGGHPDVSHPRTSRWGSNQYVWSCLEHFLGSRELRDGVHAIRLSDDATDLVYEFYLRRNDGTPVLAHFHGNAPRKHDDVPILTGFGVTEGLSATLFVLSDPMLGIDPDLTLAWHVGPSWFDVHAVTVAVIEHIVVLTSAHRVVAWGGSGGGFAAIRVARDIPGSVAFVWNPQTNISAYAPIAVDAFRRSAGFDASVRFEDDSCLNLSAPGSWGSFQGKVLYLQEESDWHVDKHLFPVLRELGHSKTTAQLSSDVVSDAGEHLVVVLAHWGIGHVPPPKYVISCVLRELTAVDPIDVAEVARSTRRLLVAARVLMQDVTPFTKMPTAPLLPMDLGADSIEIVTLTGDTVGIGRACGVAWDREYTTQLNSNKMWLHSLDYLGKLAVAAASDNVAALDWARIALTSFLEYSGEETRRSTMAAIPSSDHATAARIAALLLYLRACRHHKVDDLEHIATVVDAITLEADWLVDDSHYLANNHGLMASLSLLHAAVQLAPAPVAEQYWNTAERRLIELIATAFDKQGMCNENSVGYHRFNYVTYQRVLDFVSAHRPESSLCGTLEATLDRARGALQRAVWQNGSVPPLGDSAVYPSGVESINETTWFKQSGLAFVKVDDVYLSVTCGAPSEIHKQMDDTSITLRVEGIDIVTDAGSYKYDYADPYRRAIASSVGHSGAFPAAFDHRLRAELLREFGGFRSEILNLVELDDAVAISCRSWAERGQFSTRRDLLLTRDRELVVVDSVKLRGPLQGSGSTQRWVFGKTIEARAENSQRTVLDAGGTGYLVQQFGSFPPSMEKAVEGERPWGWASEEYGDRFGAWTLEYRSAADAARYCTVISFGAEAQAGTISSLARDFMADPRDLLEMGA